jgi:ectoine hydroxylase-related dioxygenase (phytanoyl-CoA dioxygenase family)
MASEVAPHAEAIASRGFTVLPELFSPAQLAHWRIRIDDVYLEQERAFGRDALDAIQDADACRAPLLYDFGFVELATHPRILAIIRHLLGDWLILHLQNAIISRPLVSHHQAHWHRDLVHQTFVSSRPLSVNALIAVDAFSAETGGTHVLPGTHKGELLPPEPDIAAGSIAVGAPAGSAILFDSMLFHRAGANSSIEARRAVNHQYTLPFIKQQYDFPRALAARIDLDPFLRRLFGFTSAVARDDRAWREARMTRLRETR